MWIQLFILLLSAVISYMTAPKPQKPKPASLEDFNAPQTTEGAVQIWVFGDCWIPDFFVLGMGNFRTKKIKSKSGK